MTGLLLVGGTVGLLFLEWTNPKTLGDLPVVDKILVAAFHAVNARTAGFNTIDLSQLGNASLYLIILLMFIGGSPGGTAGGIKTTTFGIIGVFVWTTLRQPGDVEFFWRRVPITVVHQALALAILAMFLLTVCTHLLSMLEHHSISLTHV